jgi:hypothetical protein
VTTLLLRIADACGGDAESTNGDSPRSIFIEPSPQKNRMKRSAENRRLLGDLPVLLTGQGASYQ